MDAAELQPPAPNDDWFHRLIYRVVDLFRVWFEVTNPKTYETGSATEGRMHPLRALASAEDPFVDLHRAYGDDPELVNRVLVGADQAGLVFGAKDQNVLALGPTRCNKTAGTLTDALIAWPGPALVTSPKEDVLQASVMARSRIGRVGQFAPDGRAYAPGLEQVRWSPLLACRSWAGALEQAEAMVSVVEGDSRSKGEDNIWSRQAVSFLAPMLFAFAKRGPSMRPVVEAVVGQDIDRIKEAATILESAGEEGHLALQSLNSVMKAHSNGAKSIILTAAAALRAYTHPTVLAQTDNPNFNPAELVAGLPEALNEDRYTEADKAMAAYSHLGSVAAGLPRGKYATLYVVNDNPVIKPIVAALIKAIARAEFEQYAADEKRRYRQRRKLLWVADELSLTPLSDLPEMLGTCASRGLMVVAAMQDLSQAERVWTVADAGGFLTLFQEFLIFRDNRNDKTLNTVSMMLGHRWETLNGFSRGFSGGANPQHSWNENEQHHRVPVLDPGEIREGNPTNPELVLAMHPGSWGWVHPLPYFRSSPWPELLVGCMEYIHHQLPDGDRRQWLPVPELDYDGDGRFLAARAHAPRLLERYRQERDWFDARRGTDAPQTSGPRRRPPAVLELSFSASDDPEAIRRTIQAAYGPRNEPPEGSATPSQPTDA